MAHELYIDQATSTASMAYVGAAPWHGLGQKLTEDAPLTVWAEQAGMNFDINSESIHFSPLEAPAPILIPNKRALYRSDTHAPLGVVSKSYKVVQPTQVLGFFKDLSEAHGFKLETAGVLFGGQKYWAMARTPYQITLPGADVIRPYLLLATACDGTMSTVARYVNTRVVCNNTIEIALNEKASQVKITHRQVFNDSQVKVQLGLVEQAWEKQAVKIETLAKRSVSQQEALDYFIKVLGNPDQALEKQKNAALLAKVHALFDGQGIGATLASSQGTAWGLLNAVTEHVDHYRGAKQDDLSKDRRLESAWFYEGAQLKQKAMDDALAMFA